MLQPVEIQDVSLRFAEEIATLRRFFSQANVACGSPRAAHEIATRVSEDRAFQRDLTSHVWVLLDACGREMRHADLLAVVTIAAVGASHAAETDEEDVYLMLRFLMEAKHRLEGTPQHASGPPGTGAAPGVPSRFSAKPGEVKVDESTSQRRGGLYSFAPSGQAKRGPSREDTRRSPQSVHRHRWPMYAFASLCLVVALVLWRVTLTRESSTHSYDADARSSAPAAIAVSRLPERNDAVPSAPPGTIDGMGGLLRYKGTSPGSTRSSESRNVPALPEAHSAIALGATSPSAKPPSPALSTSRPDSLRAGAPPAANVAAPSAVAASTASRAQPTSASPLTIRSGSGLTAVPADTISKQLDSPRLPAYAQNSDGMAGRWYPRLLRRRAADRNSAAAGGDAVMTAELHAPDLSGMSPATKSAATAAAARGVVRSTCLGMMAGNLVYGPAPAYPVAAAAARVQGEVRVQATIDRDGTVNAARIISGPPLLRDAALEAVQNWRYKPYTSGGKPVPTGAVAVVEFELQ